MDDHLIAYDLKFCPPDPTSFNRSARRLRYWLQDAHYSAVLTAETGKPVLFRFWAVEPTYPFRIQCYWYGQRSREIARDYHAAQLNKLAECYATDEWVDDWQGELVLSPWDVGVTSEEDPELEGFDDE